MSQLMRILMQADIAKCGAIDATKLDENNVLVIRFVEEKSLRDLSDKNRRICCASSVAAPLPCPLGSAEMEG